MNRTCARRPRPDSGRAETRFPGAGGLTGVSAAGIGRHRRGRASLIGLLLLAWGAAPAWAFSAEEEAWLFSDDEAVTATVNEGELAFLPDPPAEPAHEHSNHIVLSPDSLETGWATIRQCHRNLDVTGRVEVVFNAHRTRNLKITSVEGIRGAWVENNTVQLNGVLPAARLCLELQSRIVHPRAGGEFSVRNGPYMRRFLDGYYPMHVRLEVEYPCDQLQLLATEPTSQPGFSVMDKDCRVLVDAWFEGRLKTDLRFRRRHR